MPHTTTTRRTLLISAAGVAALPVVARAQQATPVPRPLGEWPVYGHDLAGTRSTTTAGVTSGTVDALAPLWEVSVGGAVSATPVTADGVVYCGSYDGNLYAIDLRSGAVVWTYATEADVQEPNLQIPLGITGSAAVVDGVVYFGDATATIHAVDAASGEARWTSTVDSQPNASIWSSPVVHDGVLYTGVASVAKETGFRGSVVALDTTDGSPVWQTYVVPEGADGGGVFAVPAIDRDRNLVYVGTQNAYSENNAPYGDPTSVLALDLTTGERRWVFRAPEHDGDIAPLDDVAFSASPNLFTGVTESGGRDLIGIGQKSGVFWALDRETGEVVWQVRVSPPGFLGGMEGSSAVSEGVIAVPATDWPEFDGPASGIVTGLDAATGAELWRTEQAAPAASPASISDDLVFHAGMDGVLHAYLLESGLEIWSYDLGASVSGGIAIAGGIVVLGVATPQFAPFVRPGNTIRAFGIIAGATVATPVP